MNDQNKNEANAEHDDVIGSVCDLLADAAADSATGIPIPRPVKQSLFKAFGRFCSAAVEVPAAYLEGMADEKRAITAARVKLTETNAEKIAEEMTVDPEYARVAVNKFGQKILREQVNLDLISAHAAAEMKKIGFDADETTEQSGSIREEDIIEDDWLNAFEKEATQKSSEDMQRIFGRILAGEIRKPSSYSIRTVKILGEMDTRVANSFRRFCSLCVSLQSPFPGHVVLDGRVVSLRGNAAQNSLQTFGFGFDHLNVLHEYGLIISDYNSYFDYRMCIAQTNNVAPMGFHYAGGVYVLRSETERSLANEFRLSGVALSKTGKELLPIVDAEENKKYTEELQKYFEAQKMRMVQVPA